MTGFTVFTFQAGITLADRYGIRTETSSRGRQISALWRAKRRRKFSQPEPSQELMDKRARLGKSYAIDEDSDHEEAEQVTKVKEETEETTGEVGDGGGEKDDNEDKRY